MTTNVFLVRWGGGWTERSDAGSIADVGRIEAPLGLGAINSLAEAQRVADGQLIEFARTRTQTDVAILPIDSTDTPYLGFNVGDVVTVEGVSHRVLGVTVTEDKDTGRAIYVPTLNDDIILTGEERIFQALRKMVNGTLGGRSKVAQPVVPRFIPRGSAADVVDTGCSCVAGTSTIAASLSAASGLADFGNSSDLCTPDQTVTVTVGAWPASSGSNRRITLSARMSAPNAAFPGSGVGGYIFYVYTDNAVGTGTTTWGLGADNIFNPLTTELTGQANPAPGDVLELSAVGTTITAKKNGVTLFTVTDSTYTDGGFAGGDVFNEVDATDLEVESFC